MLTKKDLELIDQNTRTTIKEIIMEIVPDIVTNIVTKITREIVNDELSESAIMVQNGFREIMVTKADKADVATKIDIENLESKLGAKIDKLENKFEGRIERVEDSILVIKTKLKIA